MNYLAPIVLFVYNRPKHTLRTLQALFSNDLADQSELFIYCDGARKNSSIEDIENIKEVRKIVASKKWCKKVHIVGRKENWGLKENIIDGVTYIVNKYNKIIVLEDDLETSKYFLRYMNDALSMYEDEESVMHISGYVPFVNMSLPETYFLRYMSCWGWATWKRAWNHYDKNTIYLHDSIKSDKLVNSFNIAGSYKNLFEQLEKNLDGRLNTWAINWYASIFLKKGLCLYPKVSLIKNIGLDGSGTNSSYKKAGSTIENIDAIRIHVSKIYSIMESKIAFSAFKNHYRKYFRLNRVKSFILGRMKEGIQVIKILWRGGNLFKMIRIRLNNTEGGNCFKFRMYSKVRLSLSDKIHVRIQNKMDFGLDAGRFPRGSRSSLRFGKNSSFIVKDKFKILSGCDVNIDDNATLVLGSGYINHDTKVYCKNRIEIGYNTIIAEDVIIMDSDSHQINDSSAISKPILIGDRVWIGMGAMILKGVTIGDGSVVAARSVVTKNIPPNSIVAGNPAKIIKQNIHWSF